MTHRELARAASCRRESWTSRPFMCCNKDCTRYGESAKTRTHRTARARAWKAWRRVVQGRCEGGADSTGI